MLKFNIADVFSSHEQRELIDILFLEKLTESLNYYFNLFVFFCFRNFSDFYIFLFDEKACFLSSYLIFLVAILLLLLIILSIIMSQVGLSPYDFACDFDFYAASLNFL